MASNDTCVIAIDAGTTGVRSRAVFVDDRPAVASYREFTQHFPQPGWVEHDALEIWDAVKATLADVVDTVGRRERRRDRHHQPARDGGRVGPRHRAAARQRDRVAGPPHGGTLRRAHRRRSPALVCVSVTGLVLDPYFSGTKFEWLLRERRIPIDEQLALGTIDAWLIWNLTGGEVHATDVTNASRTMLYDIGDRQWSSEMCELLDVPIQALPDVRPSSGRFGVTSDRCGVPAGIPISGVAGDQQAALFGQACFEPGMAKNTYGTGSFVLLNVGADCPPPTEGMLTTIAWELADGTVAYALEGAIFVTGAAIQWLRDGIDIIERAADAGPLAASVTDTGGVYVVPAFTGLGSPWWDPYARGTIVGITRGTTRAHVTRAVIESMAYQTRDVIDAMVAASGIPISDLRVDGGASVMDLLLQIQADQLGVAVCRPTDEETTALGAAFLAGLAEGVWPDLDAIRATWKLDAKFEPADDRTFPDLFHAQWLRAVERSRGWASR